jgi:hypothetical protein
MGGDSKGTKDGKNVWHTHLLDTHLSEWYNLTYLLSIARKAHQLSWCDTKASLASFALEGIA